MTEGRPHTLIPARHSCDDMQHSTNGNPEWAHAVIETFVPGALASEKTDAERDVTGPEQAKNNA